MSNPIDQAKELLELHGKTTPGEWYVNQLYPHKDDGGKAPSRYVEGPSSCICSTGTKTRDVEFIAASHNLIPSICQALIEREERVRVLEEAIDDIRDAVLHQRFQLAEVPCDSDFINAVLGIIDDNTPTTKEKEG